MGKRVLCDKIRRQANKTAAEAPNALPLSETDFVLTILPIHLGIIDSFKQTKQAVNTAEDVAKYIVGLEVAPEMNGKAIYGMLAYVNLTLRLT